MENKKALIPPKGSRKDTKRVGRGTGSGWGATSGQGNKGAQARSGYRRKGGFEGGQIPLLRRLPKFGFNNKRFQKTVDEISLADLDAIGKDTVDREVLKAGGFIASDGNRIKVLGDGAITRAVTVTVDAVSKSAREKIEKAGGKVVLIEHKVWQRTRPEKVKKAKKAVN
ncbi:MAG: 50S ribosomal protein L15 [Spirochaetota bacterium]